MNKIPFTSGTLSKVDFDYYTLVLHDKTGKKVYTATIGRLKAASLMNKHDNIKMA